MEGSIGTVNEIRREHPLSNSELKTLRKMMGWYDRMLQAEQDQDDLERELADFPTNGDGY